jgi:hypothetical protein
MDMSNWPAQGYDEPYDVWFDSNDVGWGEGVPDYLYYGLLSMNPRQDLTVGEWIVAGMEDLRVPGLITDINEPWFTMYLPYADRRLD